MKNLFTACWVLVGMFVCPIAYAQQLDATTPNALPYFVGVNAFQTQYEVFFHPSTDDNATVSINPWQLTAGGNLTPRLALQIGYSYRHEVDHLDPSYTGTSISGQYLSGASNNDSWMHSIPLLARYTFLGVAPHRFKVDILLGLTLLHTRELAEAERRIDNQVVFRASTDVQATQLYLSGGFGVRYLFGRRVEGVLDWTYNRNFICASVGAHLQATGNEYGLTRAISVGLRYRFAVKEKAAATAGS